MKSAVVLGSEGGLGKKIVLALSNEGYMVYGSSRSGESKSDTHITFQFDISITENIDSFIDKLKEFAPFDVFTSTISNKPLFNRFESISDNEFKLDIKINILNHIYFIKKIIPLMNKNSNFVFILSEYVFGTPPKYSSSYVASKYYLLGLMKILSEELEPKKIRVNALSPGMMATKFIDDIPNMVKKLYVENSNNNSFTDPKKVADKFIEVLKDNSLNGENILVL